LIIGWKLVALNPILIVGHWAAPEPIAGHGPPLGLQLGVGRLLCKFERLAAFRSALLSTHHARYRKESRIAIQ
jgi:hypothetical protein